MVYATGDDGFADSQLTARQRIMLQDYEELVERKIGEVVRSATDARMSELGWQMPTEDGAWPSSSTDCWKFSETNHGRAGISKVRDLCSVPGVTGRGGGYAVKTRLVNQSEEKEYYSVQDVFEEVREAIHGAADKFVGCPRPLNSGSVANVYRDIADTFDPDHGAVSTKIELIESDSQALTGTTARAYKSTFLWSIDTVLIRYCGLASEMGSFMMAQSAMWAAAEADVMIVLDTSRKAFDKVAEKKAPAESCFDDFVRVGEFILEVVGVFVPDGAAKKAVDAALLGVGAIPKGEAPREGGTTYAGVLNDFKANLKAIETQIDDVESRIHDNAGADLDRIATAKSINWELPTPGSLDLSDEPDIAMDRQHVYNIHGHMNEIVDILNSGVGDARDQDAPLVSSVMRPTGLGWGHYGPALVLQELNDMMCDFLGRLRDQIDRSADNLLCAYQYQAEYNAQVAADLQASAANLQALDTLTGYTDPRVYDKTPAPSPVDSRTVRDAFAGEGDFTF